MPNESRVAGFLLIVLAAAAMFDLVAILMVGGDATISSVVRVWSSRWPIIPLLAGLLAGHLFWQ